jgi:ribosomal-protein-alanine N-acetyltransferase
MSSISVRRMQETDLPPVILLDCMSFTLPWPPSAYQHELKNSASRIWVAEIVLEQTLVYHPPVPLPIADIEKGIGERAVVGVLVQWMVADEAHIATLAVHPQMRGRGIGEKLLQTALRQALDEGVVKVFLEVRAGNLAAQRLYTKYNFQIVGRRPHYYKDNGEDALLMTLEGLQVKDRREFHGG